tara:strand:+ start:261 stop:896 length:636 start_codon:yes stop_codon:yes gene_type:complete
MTKLVKYPSTYHLPWSRSVTENDKVLTSLEHFVGRRVVVTEKMDGESCSMYTDAIHARSLDSRHHPSRDWIKAFWGAKRNLIPEGWRLCGENLYAEHSIRYDQLPSYFMLFSIWDENNVAQSWDATVEWCELLEMKHVPILFDGQWDENIVKGLWDKSKQNISEGYVVRLAEPFHFDNFKTSIAKFVRRGHVQTDEHWMHSEIVPNGLEEL